MRTWLIALAFFIAASVASAQVAEIGLGAGAMRMHSQNIGTIGATTAAGDIANIGVSLTNGWLFGFRLTLNNWRFFGHEFGYHYNRTQLRFETSPPQESGMAVHQGFYNFLVYALPEGSAVRPFVTGGGHFSNFTPPGTSVTQGGGSTKFGVNYGGGIKARVSSKFGIRFDVRDYFQGKPFDLPNQSGGIHLMEISAGFSLLL